MQFSTIYYQNPRSDNGDGKFYPRPVYVRTVTMEELVADITHATSLTAADVTAAITELSAVIRRHLVYGHKVQLDDIGTFKLSFKGTGHESAEDVTAADITQSSIRVTMLVDYGLRQYVQRSTTFSKVRARKPKDADAAAVAPAVAPATDSATAPAVAPATEPDSDKTE